jgi:hypothetical protein
MTYKKACAAYRKACKSAGIEPAELTEKQSKRRGDSWQLCSTGQHGFAELQGIVCENGDVIVGRKLTAHVARLQRMAIDSQNWTDKTLPQIKQRNGTQDKPPQKPPPKPRPMTTQQITTATTKSPFDRQ